MPKLLIIEDHIQMVKILQAQMEKINSLFNKENTFCFSPSEESTIVPLTEEGLSSMGQRVNFAEKGEGVFDAILQFLEAHSDEKVLILLDVLLRSQNITTPNYARYTHDAEFSCELYAELLKLKNGKPCKYNVTPGNYFVLIYSRSEASIGVVVKALSRIYAQNVDEHKFFPQACCQLENISWAKNSHEKTDLNHSVEASQLENFNPLALPIEYIDFFKKIK